MSWLNNIFGEFFIVNNVWIHFESSLTNCQQMYWTLCRCARNLSLGSPSSSLIFSSSILQDWELLDWLSPPTNQSHTWNLPRFVYFLFSLHKASAEEPRQQLFLPLCLCQPQIQLWIVIIFFMSFWSCLPLHGKKLGMRHRKVQSNASRTDKEI